SGHALDTEKLVLSCTQTQSFGSQVGVEEPQCVPDQECLKCAQCNSKFNLIPRMHHCHWGDIQIPNPGSFRFGWTLCGRVSRVLLPLTAGKSERFETMMLRALKRQHKTSGMSLQYSGAGTEDVTQMKGAAGGDSRSNRRQSDGGLAAIYKAA
ncbi:hypothetical protein EI555_020451, partial [Monodon monoceros]